MAAGRQRRGGQATAGTAAAVLLLAAGVAGAVPLKFLEMYGTWIRTPATSNEVLVARGAWEQGGSGIMAPALVTTGTLAQATNAVRVWIVVSTNPIPGWIVAATSPVPVWITAATGAVDLAARVSTNETRQTQHAGTNVVSGATYYGTSGWAGWGPDYDIGLGWGSVDEGGAILGLQVWADLGGIMIEPIGGYGTNAHLYAKSAASGDLARVLTEDDAFGLTNKLVTAAVTNGLPGAGLSCTQVFVDKNSILWTNVFRGGVLTGCSSNGVSL